MRAQSGNWGFRAIICLLWGLCIFSTPAMASEDQQFEYDIFWLGDTLSCWIDITPVLTQQRLEDLLSGLDIYIVFDLKLERPRKLLFSKTIARQRTAVIISRRVTRDIYQLEIIDQSRQQYTFPDQLDLHDFLADSLVLPLILGRDLEDEGDPRLNASIICKSLIHNNKTDDIDNRDDSPLGSPNGGEDIFKDIFSLFLDLVGFGESSYKIKSPIFQPNKLPSGDN